MIALTTDSKSLLTRIRSAEALAALQPEPIANPISDAANDSMSLIPSPVVATFFPDLLRPTVNKSLC